ncbi:MAG: RNA polymerase sigma factor [Muribaculaceae bacterium]|nr:RNA polymerase sigma factor [Muribaculaceae bacterium]
MLNRIDELKLIAQCIAYDNRDAFGQLVTAYEQGLRRFLYNLCEDEALTDDLAQDTFLKAYLAIRSFQGISRFKTWLYRIGYNEYLSYRRSQRPTIDEFSSIKECDNPSLITDAQLTVEQCLTQLSEIERTIVILFYLEDMPIKKIVEITGIPNGTVKSHLYRAKSRMKQFLVNDSKI